MQRNSRIGQELWLWLGLALVALPFLIAALSSHTFAPVDVLYTMSYPYAHPGAGFPQSHFWSDTVNFYWPRLATLANGEFPIAYSSGGGLPLFADTISGFFSPFAWLSFGLFPATSYFTLDLFWYLQYAVFFAGWYVFVRGQGAKPQAAFLSGISQVFCTHYFVGSYLSFQSLGAMVFLPFALHAYSLGRAGDRWNRYLLAPLFLALCVYAGNVQTALFPALIFSVWSLLQRDWKGWLYTGFLSVLFSLPLWLTGIEYHWLQNIGALDRRSQVPEGTLAKLKALLALPALLFPDWLGSPRHIDGLKAFATSATYFYGSLGFVMPLFIVSAWRNLSGKNHLRKAALWLLALTFLVLISPALNFLYYRIFCVMFFALGLAGALLFSDLANLDRKILQITSASIFVLSLIWVLAFYFIKIQYHPELKSFLLEKLQASVSNGWLPGFDKERVDRFLQFYAWGPRVFWLLICTFTLAVFAKKISARILVLIFLIDLFSAWTGAILWQPQKKIENPDFTYLQEKLRESPNYPFARFSIIPCGVGQILFAYPQNEFFALPKLGQYGSTRVAALTEAEIICDTERKTVRARDGNEYWRKAGVEILLSNKGWHLLEPDFQLLAERENYLIWQRKSSTRLVPHAEHGKIISYNSWGWKASFTTKKQLSEWQISQPDYPGWHYYLNEKEIFPVRKEQSMPVFVQNIFPGMEYGLRAEFQPRTLYYGLIGLLLALIGGLGMVYGQRKKN